MYQYILLEKIQYEGIWILGVVNSLDEALEHFSKIYNKTYDESSDEENSDKVNYISYWIEEWDRTKKVRTYKYNNITRLLEKQKSSQNELD